MKTITTKIVSLKKLASILINYADSFSFVIREDVVLNPKVSSIIEDLSIYLIERKSVSQWPGTKLLMDKAEIFHFYLNSETALILVSYNDALFRWVHPDLPEDLTFLKNENPVFVSITHEEEAYFILDSENEKYLKDKI